jgi:hypothetical protein
MTGMLTPLTSPQGPRGNLLLGIADSTPRADVLSVTSDILAKRDGFAAAATCPHTMAEAFGDIAAFGAICAPLARSAAITTNTGVLS